MKSPRTLLQKNLDMSAKRKNVVIDNALVLAMARDQRFLTEFGFLSGLARLPKKGGCGSCARKSVATDASLEAAKRALTQMSTEKKEILRNLLNAEKAEVRILNGSKVELRVI